MKLPFLQLWYRLQSSYWFIPSVMAALALLLGVIMVALDIGPAEGLLSGIGWYQSVKPDGAHEVLSTIAGSMITVAGVVFSITIVALAYAASQYGPRVLTNFMHDRGNQVTLGTFIATFVYCLVVLRTIRGGDEGEFVPQLAVMVGILFALASIGVLIYFIHHVTQSIHVNTITARVGGQLIDSIGKRFPACVGDPLDRSETQRAISERRARDAFANGDIARIGSAANGYLQTIDDDRLFSAACEHDVVICLERQPGQFLHRGATVALVHPAGRVTDDIADELRRSWTIGSKRTPEQDLLFLVDELVEIGARALSTGVNDPYTAMTCTNWLVAALAELARRRPPDPFRLDDEGNLRLIAETNLFEDILKRGLGRLRPYVARDVNAASHFLSAIGSLGDQSLSPGQIDALNHEAQALLTLARDELDGPSLRRVEEEMAGTREALAKSAE